MNATKKAWPSIGRFLYGIGGLSGMTEVVFLLLFLTEFAEVHDVALLVGATAGIALPVLIMPLCYAFVNGNTAIGTGRYHLPMSVSLSAASLCFVLLLGVGGASPIGQGFAVFGLLFAYSLGMQIFSYTYFAIGQRFDQSGTAAKIRSAFGLVSVALSALLILFLSDGSRDSVRAIVAFAGVVSLLCVAVIYFSTVHAMPSFVRLEPRTKRRIGEQYARFVSPLRRKSTAFFALSVFFVCAGVSLAAATLPSCVFAYMFGINKGYKPAVLAMAALIAPVGIAVTRAGKNGGKACSVLAVGFAAAQICAAAAVIVAICVPVAQVYKAVVLFAFSAFAGCAFGAALAAESKNKERAVQDSGCTPGRYYCLRNALAALGISCGVLLACVVRIVATHVGGKAAAVVSCVVFAVLLLIGTLCGRTAYGKERSE